MARTKKNYEVKKNEILDVAESLFIKKGYDKTTIKDILDTAGISKGGFYHYFPTKESILHSVIERVVDNIVIKTKRVLADSSLNPIKKLKAILSWSKNFSTNQFQSRRIIKDFYLNKNKTLIYHFHLEFMEKMSPLLLKIMEEGIEKEYFKDTLYVNQTVEVIVMMVLSANFLTIGKDRDEIKKYLYSIENIMERALGLKEGVLTVL